MANEITIKVSADNKASKEFDDVKEKAGGLKNALGGVATVAGGFVVGAGIQQLGGFLISAAQGAAEDEQSMLRLQQAVNNTGATFDQYKGALDASIQSAQDRAFTDDQARDSLALLMAQTGNADEAMRRFALAQDVARGAGIPLEQASRLLGKVTAENVDVFAKMGISLQEGATEAEAFAALQGKFAGQADVYANSTAGQFEITKIQMGELKERIGAQLLPVMASLGEVLVNDVIPTLTKMGDYWEQKLRPAIEEFVRAEIIPELETAFAQLKQTIDGLMPIAEDILNWFKENPAAIAAVSVVLGALLVALFPIPAGIVAIMTAGTLLLAHWDDIRNKIEEVRLDFEEKFPELVIIVETAFELIKNRIETTLAVIKNIFDFWVAIFKGDWDRAWQEVKDTFKVIIEGLLTEWQIIIDGVVSLATTIGPRLADAIRTGWNDHVAPFLLSLPGTAYTTLLELGEKAWHAGMDAMQKLAGGIQRGVISFVNDAIDSVIDALNPTNWDLPGLSPYREAFDHAGKIAMGQLAGGIRSESSAVKQAVMDVAAEAQEKLATWWQALKDDAAGGIVSPSLPGAGSGGAGGSTWTNTGRDETRPGTIFSFDESKALARVMGVTVAQLKEKSVEAIAKWLEWQEGSGVNIVQLLMSAASSQGLVGAAQRDFVAGILKDLSPFGVSAHTKDLQTAGITININALDGQSVKNVIPEIAKELQAHLRTAGAVAF